jgi:hypothetical protein
MPQTLPGRQPAVAGTVRPDRIAVAAPPIEAGTQDNSLPIAPPPDTDPGQRDEGCRFIAADIEWRRWRYCGKPIRRGAWCAAHDAACHRWRGFEDRQRLGEELVRRIAEEEPHVAG